MQWVLEKNVFVSWLWNLEADSGPLSLRGRDYLDSVWKRIFDMSVSSVLAVLVALPVSTLAVLAMEIENPGIAPFHIQHRYGKKGRSFPMLKITSQREQTVGTYKIVPTKVGKVLRKFSVDELPQVFNVLSGKMSVVGRRPTLPVDYDRFEEWMLVHWPYQLAKKEFNFTDEEWTGDLLPPKTKEQIIEFSDTVRETNRIVWERYRDHNFANPGLTGVYQIGGRRNLQHHERISRELWYEQNATLGMDMAIILMTISAVFSQEGAL